MFSNREVAEIYLKSWNEQNVLNFVNQNLNIGDDILRRTVDVWIRTFKYHWRNIRSRNRFFERKADWLELPFEVLSPSPRSVPTKVDKQTQETPPSCQNRGRNPKPFQLLTEETKVKYCQDLARGRCVEELLRAAETAARKVSCRDMSRVLRKLRKGKEVWASQALKALRATSVQKEPSPETSLMVKTRLGLSKSKYSGLNSFMRKELKQRTFVPWAEMIAHRNRILPKFSDPNYDEGYLSSTVLVRELLSNDVMRIVELEDVQDKLNEIASSEIIDCVMHVAAGPDSATGFSHYNQAKFLGKDDSLLTEHFMSLKLVSESGHEIYENPNPQSDMFCRACSMHWTKETDEITRKLFDQFFKEVEDLNASPIIIDAGIVTLRVKIKAIYSLIDGKAANAIVENRNTKACPLCVKVDERIGPSYFHSRLNLVEGLIRNAAKKAIPNQPAMSHPDVKKEARRIADELEAHFKVNVNRPKIGGSGSSNNGNMARRLLAQPTKFAEILGVNVDLISNIRLISSLALSSKKLDINKIKKLYTDVEQQYRNEFPFVRQLPPCLHKYEHLPELIARLPYTMNFVDEQAGETSHKHQKFSRLHFARKTSAEDNLADMMRQALTWSDPKMAYLSVKSNGKNTNSKHDKEFEAQMLKFCASDDLEHEGVSQTSESDEEFSEEEMSDN